MKIKIPLGLTLAVGLCASAFAQTIPTFQFYQATGTTLASIIIPQTPTSQVRVVSAIASSDLASGTLSFYSGTTAHYVTATNSATNVATLLLEATNGVTSSLLVYIQGAGTNGVFTITSLQTNGITLTGNINFIPPVNSEVEFLQAVPEALLVGAKNNVAFASDGLFVGNYGRMVYATLTGTSACTNYVTIHRDATSQ